MASLRAWAFASSCWLLACSETAEDRIRSGTVEGGLGPLPGAIQGLHYRSGERSGYTDDSGRFSYRDGDRIELSVGDLVFESTDARAALSPFQLANGSGCAPGAALERVLRTLVALDEDGDPKNGLALPEAAAPSAPLRLSELDEASWLAAVEALHPGVTVPDAASVVEAFVRQIDGEEWSAEPGTTFQFPDSAYRGQGVASDGSAWIFSAANHLQRTDAAFEALVNNEQPIPLDISKQGGKHIGDIDVHDGLLYASIEDGPDFLHPWVVTYDAKTLEPTGTRHELPQELHLKGVPWVAIDAPRKRVYTAEWDPTERINVFDLENELAALAPIPLRTTIGRIQGAKVFGGAIYASSDNENKSIYKIDPDTGVVIELFTLGTPKSEVEGLALSFRAQRAELHVLNVVVPTVEFVERSRTRAPLRDDVCP